MTKPIDAGEERRAPVLVGVGEASGGSLGAEWPSPVDLASAAVRAAVEDARAPGLADALDCLLATRLFYDSGLPHGFGSPDNYPHAIAEDAGVDPAALIYGDVGGQSPQRHLNELAVDLYEGKHKAVVLCGAEAVGTVKRATKQGHQLDWNRPSDRDFTDLRRDFPILTKYEIRHGIISMPMAYGLMENAYRARLGWTCEDHAAAMAELWAGLSKVAPTRTHAQFARRWTADELLEDDHGNYRLNDPYRRWMVAQDGVELGAAVVMTTAGTAADLGIAPDRLVYLWAGADASAPLISEQADLSRSPAMDWAMTTALDLAEQQAQDIGPIDIYSCFPVAVSLGIEALGIERGGAGFTMTGGLTFFGGPGNGYSTHAIAAMVQALREDGSKPALISANGGVISKESVGVYAARPVEGGWTPDRIATPMALAADDGTRAAHMGKGAGVITTYALPFVKGEPGAATVRVEDEAGLPLFALLGDAPTDTDLTGQRVTIANDGKRNHATLTS